jgi:hypothetical protein
MSIVADYFDEDPGSPHHTMLRDECWMGGPFHEGRYFLSCATGVNEFRRNNEEFFAGFRSYIESKFPDSTVFLESSYWIEFFIVLLRQCYRESKIGKRYPIREERRDEKALRMLLLQPELQEADLVAAMKTTEKQVRRMSVVQLALREKNKLASKKSNKTK